MIMGPKSNDWSPYEEREKFGDMGRRWSCEDGGRDWSHVATSQGTIRMANNHQKIKRAREEFSRAFSRGGPTITLIL
jgi:hypothetical protein